MDPRIKICGLTGKADAMAAVEAGADFLGFVLYPKSPRFIEASRLREIVNALPPEPPKVGIFVKESPADIEDAVRFCGLDIAQLHGSEPMATARRIGAHRVWRALALRSPQDVSAAAAECPELVLLVDSMAPGKWGGTGQVGDWDLAAELAAQRPVVLAGGLTPENVAAAIAKVRPFAVDVSSGVELAPGQKDHARIRTFVAAARASCPHAAAGTP